jgi:hypothetical protein
MVIGETFAWAHMGKTAGDATLALFETVSDLVVFRHERTDRGKHVTFSGFGDEALNKPMKLLNIRRLPSWQLSIAHHRVREGTAADPTPWPLPTADEMASSHEADAMLLSFTKNGELDIHQWLRAESLRSDFAEFVQELRPLTDAERQQIMTVTTKPVSPYNHDYTNWFTNDQLTLLYENNPYWAAVEWQVYGGLPEGVKVPVKDRVRRVLKTAYESLAGRA